MPSKKRSRSQGFLFVPFLRAVAFLSIAVGLGSCTIGGEPPTESDLSSYAPFVALTEGNMEDGQLQADADGRRIVFERSQPGEENKIILMDLATVKGRYERELAPLTGAHFPGFLGKRVLLALDRVGKPVSLDLASEVVSDLSFLDKAGKPQKPKGSPDGKSLVFFVHDAKAIEQALSRTGKPFVPTLWMADVQAKTVQTFTFSSSESNAFLERVEWAGPQTLQLSYRVEDAPGRLVPEMFVPENPATPVTTYRRIEQVSVDGSTKRLVFFHPYDGTMRLAADTSFLWRIAPDHRTLLFSKRNLENETGVVLPGPVLDVENLPGRKAVVAAVDNPKTKGINLFLVPVPEAVFDKPSRYCRQEI